MTEQINLWVNSLSVQLDHFAQAFIEHTIDGMVSSLRDSGETRDVAVTIEANEVTISLNGALLPIKPFVSDIVRNTIIGMVSSLKGVDRIDNLNITIVRSV
ncbi:hypothetical protein ACFLW3_00790 [Chloroflexota bacterium]